MLKEYLSTLANKFRETLGTTEKINAQDFPTKITEVIEKGRAEGFDEGIRDGRELGIEEGIEQGKQAEYDAFWNSYQENGTRTVYLRGFSGECWNSENFKPKYKIVLNSNSIYQVSVEMFSYFDVRMKKPPLEIREGDIDFSGNVYRMTGMFKNSNITVVEMNAIPAILERMDSTFAMVDIGAHVLHTLKLGTREETTYDTYSFYCISLENVSFLEGSVIGQNILFQISNNLTHDSLMNIISVLKDYSGTEITKTLTLHADAKAKLTDSEKAIATQKGWTIA